MGGLVQQPAPARADRKHPTRRGRSPLPRARRDPIFGRVTQANLPPANSVRFKASAPSRPSPAPRSPTPDALLPQLPKVSMSATPKLALPLLAAAQAQKHVTHNEALSTLDALDQLAVRERRS